MGIRALVGVFRAFAGRVSTMLSWGGIRGGEAFGLSWRGFRAFAMKAFAGKTSGFGGGAFEGGFRALVGRILGFRGRIWAFVGDFGLSWGDSWEGFGLSNRLYESKAAFAFKTNRFCKSNRFYTV